MVTREGSRSFFCAIVEAQNVVSGTNTGILTGIFINEKMPNSY